MWIKLIEQILISIFVSEEVIKVLVLEKVYSIKLLKVIKINEVVNKMVNYQGCINYMIVMFIVFEVVVSLIEIIVIEVSYELIVIIAMYKDLGISD